MAVGYLLLFRMLTPYLKKTHGMGNISTDKKPSRLVAQPTPNALYTFHGQLHSFGDLKQEHTLDGEQRENTPEDVSHDAVGSECRRAVRRTVDIGHIQHCGYLVQDQRVGHH